MKTKAQAYDEALEKAREALNDGTISSNTIAYLQDIFPELKESEDERIKHEIKVILANTDLSQFALDYTFADMLAWLEKQGEFYTKRDVDNAYIEGMAFAKNELEKQGKQKGYTFKSIPRLLDMIEPSDKAKAYCQKLIDTLAKEGYNTDAKIVEVVLNGWNGVDVPMAIMDEQKPVFEMKTPEESLGIDSDTYNKIVDECIYGDGEQNPTDKLEPKFHEGEWIVWKDKCYKVNYNGCGYELVDQDGLSTSLEYGTIDENAHIWDVTTDAKDGDVLISRYNKPFIYNGNWNSLNIGSYCGITTEGMFNVATEKCYWTGNVNIHPATKEQRDLLFQKMKESGYEWDADKKELKKIEDEPENYKQQLMSEMTNLVKDYIRQKPAWSEEDECYMSECIGAIATKDGWSFEEKRKTKHWLKSLKERVLPQPKQEWSEEDERTYKSITYSFVHNYPLTIQQQEFVKSLKQRIGG